MMGARGGASTGTPSGESVHRAMYGGSLHRRGVCQSHRDARRIVSSSSSSSRLASRRLVSSRVVLFLFAKSGVHRARREGNAGQVYYGIYRLPAGLKRRNEDTSEERPLRFEDDGD